jgi:hypothetical protein
MKLPGNREEQYYVPLKSMSLSGSRITSLFDPLALAPLIHNLPTSYDLMTFHLSSAMA